jgi:hypothetical protein
MGGEEVAEVSVDLMAQGVADIAVGAAELGAANADA